MNQIPIDAVITWVDGHDPMHQKKLHQFLALQGIDRPETADPTRFNQSGEIEYCVHSILRFAPWIRTIFIVTDAQIPPLFQKISGTSLQNRVRLIDHRDIFAGFEHCLPTFNSITIESMLWRIPDLSEHFIYFNDDVVLMRPVTHDDFFRDNKLVLRGRWKLSSQHPLYRLYYFLLKTAGFSKAINLHRVAQENSALLTHIHHWFFHFPHIPFPLKKSTFEDYFKTAPQRLSENIEYRLRSEHQFLPVSLAYHLEIQRHTVHLDRTLQAVGVDAARHPLSAIQHKLLQAENNQHVAFVCMQGIDTALPSTKNFMLEWLNRFIGRMENG